MRSERGAFLDAAGDLAHRSRRLRSGAATAATGWVRSRRTRARRSDDRVAGTRRVRRDGRRGPVPGRAATRLDDDELRAAALGRDPAPLDHAAGSGRSIATGLRGLDRSRVRGCAGGLGAGLCAGARGCRRAPAGMASRATRSPLSDLMSGCAGAVVGLLASRRWSTRHGWSQQPGTGRRGGGAGPDRSCGVVVGNPDSGRCVTYAASPTARRGSGSPWPSCSPSPVTRNSARGRARLRLRALVVRSVAATSPTSAASVARRAAMSRCRPLTPGATAPGESRCRGCARRPARSVALARRQSMRSPHASGTAPTSLPGPRAISRSATAPPAPVTCCFRRPQGRRIRTVASQPTSGCVGSTTSTRAGPAVRDSHGTTPELLLGIAGIGMFYLRLFDADIASPLLVHGRTSTAASPPP